MARQYLRRQNRTKLKQRLGLAAALKRAVTNSSTAWVCLWLLSNPAFAQPKPSSKPAAASQDVAAAAAVKQPPELSKSSPVAPLETSCRKLVDLFSAGTSFAPTGHRICKHIVQRQQCRSVNGDPIFHYDKTSNDASALRILVFGLIHGDEMQSGIAAASWMSRLTSIEPRNSWRIVPVLNPDGLKNKSRVNANGIDINRNFPTRDWSENAIAYWLKFAKKDPRRNPGEAPSSELETQCAIAHIEEFKPDFIVAIHTPYGTLDLDGPKDILLPKSQTGLPWVSLGHFPGSLGRFMWHDQKLPVLTIELTGTGRLDQFDKLQDISSLVAIKAADKIQPRKML